MVAARTTSLPNMVDGDAPDGGGPPVRNSLGHTQGSAAKRSRRDSHGSGAALQSTASQSNARHSVGGKHPR